MPNDFQKWLISQGFKREHGTHGAWVKDGVIVSGKLLSDKLEEWKKSIQK